MTERASTTHDTPAFLPDGLLVLGLSAAGTAAAWAVFASRPPMKVLVGMRVLDDVWVPAQYQASAFPAFFSFAAALGLDVLKGRSQGSRAPRAALLGLTGFLSTLRLGGALPLSGHAVFLSAALAYGLTAPRAPDATPGGGALTTSLAAAGLLVTAYYKLAVWNDATWLIASALVGSALGGAASTRSRAVL